MRKTNKKIISLFAVLIFALALIPTSAFADPFSSIAIGGIGGISGAGLFSSMASASGFNISYGNNPTADSTEALWSSLNPDHVYFSGSKGQVTDIDPVTELPTVYDYIQVDISDWLDAQHDFIEEYVSTYNVVDNSSGSGLTNKKYLSYPFENTYSTTVYGPVLGYCTPGSSISYGNARIDINSNLVASVYNNGRVWTTVSVQDKAGLPIVLSTQKTGGDTTVYWSALNSGVIDNINSAYVTSGGSYTSTWTSNTVNTSVFDNYSDPIVKIPHDSWSPSDPVNWSVQEYLAELTRKLISGTESDIIIEDSSSPVPPVPVPTTPLGDIPTDEWYDLFGLPVLEGQEEIHQDLQDFNDSVSEGLDDIGEQLDDAADSLGSIDTNIQTGNGLLGDLKSIGQNILSTLNSILSGVTDLVQEIVLSTETFIAGLLNSIIGGLGGWLSTMRDAFSIWHYVVEWVGSISTVFSWFWSVAGSTSYYIQLPIYASLAGAVVLAFYKRFGK